MPRRALGRRHSALAPYREPRTRCRILNTLYLREMADVLYLSYRLSVGPIAQNPRGLGQPIVGMWSRVVGRAALFLASDRRTAPCSLLAWTSLNRLIPLCARSMRHAVFAHPIKMVAAPVSSHCVVAVGAGQRHGPALSAARVAAGALGF
jgi:hypothetical protein